ALNRGVRKVIKTRTMFPHEESAKKLIYLALQRIYNLMRRNCDFSGSGAPLHSRRRTLNHRITSDRKNGA
ncbi:MAG: hypothetical protein EGQ76_02030, partial [Sutterella sp.]|nr:hypothetical protein [Sutterella sp.]